MIELTYKKGDFTIYYKEDSKDQYQICLTHRGNNYFNALTVANHIKRFDPFINIEQKVIDQYFEHLDSSRLDPNDIVDKYNLFTKREVNTKICIYRHFFDEDFDRAPEFGLMCGTYIPECLFNDFADYIGCHYRGVHWFVRQGPEDFTAEALMNEDSNDVNFDDGFTYIQYNC